MSTEAFGVWLDGLVAQNRMLEHERDRLMRGREIYDANREIVEADYPGRFVGFVGDEVLVADSAKDLLNRAGSNGRPLYFEHVPGVGAGGPTETEERERVVH